MRNMTILSKVITPYALRRVVLCLLIIVLGGILFRGDALRHFASNGNLAGISVALTLLADPDAAEPKLGITPLMLASKGGRKAAVEALFNAGANVNIQDSNGDTALHYAVGDGREEIVGFLLSKGAEVNARNRLEGDTPLMVALDVCRPSLVRLLLQNGAEMTAPNNAGTTPMARAQITCPSALFLLK